MQVIELNLPQQAVARIKRKQELESELFDKFFAEIFPKLCISERQYDRDSQLQRMIIDDIYERIAQYHIANNTEFAAYYLNKR